MLLLQVAESGLTLCTTVFIHPELRMRARKQKIIVKEDAHLNKKLPYDDKCCACPKSKKELRVEEEERQFEIKFENFLHDTVYIKRYVA